MSKNNKLDDILKKITHKKEVCNSCGGKGYYDSIGDEPCDDCAGTGRDVNSDLWSEPCRGCNGSGKKCVWRKNVCSSCSGTGYLN